MNGIKKRAAADAEPLYGSVWKEYEKGVSYNSGINLYDTVENNENFFIGKQWEGVKSNGLPTPVFNFLKRVTLFTVSSVSSSSLKINVAPIRGIGEMQNGAARLPELLNAELDGIFEDGGVMNLVREFVRNAAVDGDGAMHVFFEPDAETGQSARGKIRTELVENTRVIFGNPNDRAVQKQPYIIISSRKMADEVRELARKNGCADWEAVSPDSGDAGAGALEGDGRTTVLLRYRRDRASGKIFACECTKNAVLRPEWNTGLSLYPLCWLCWDYVQNCYHGQALITGLIPNQIFVNKLFAMAMISLMTTAYPKIVYDKTRVSKWDSRVGAAIGINGGDVNNVAKIIDPAAVSPQISQFISLAVDYTQTFLGATPSALGDVNPENSAAILALQRASGVPIELTRQNLYQCIEELGRIYLDFMGRYYGIRYVTGGELFDFRTLGSVPLRLKLDVGAAAYWSELASLQTLDNLLREGKIGAADYLERLPEGYISKKQELIEKLRSEENAGC